MAQSSVDPRALFLFPDEPPQPDTEVCSGRYRDWLEGAACPYSDAGRMPLPGGGGQGPLGAGAVPSGLGFPCVVAELGPLRDWRSGVELQFPPELGRLTLFKCKQMFLLVVAGGSAER